LILPSTLIAIKKFLHEQKILFCSLFFSIDLRLPGDVFTSVIICKMALPSFHIVVYGLLNSDEYQLAKNCLEDLKRTHPKQIYYSEFRPLLEYEWNSFLRTKRAELRGETWAFNDNCMVFVDKELLGNAEQFLNWAKTTFDHADFRANELLGVLSNEEYKYVDFLKN
jgi:hypothetical protein